MKAHINDFKKLIEARVDSLPIILLHGSNVVRLRQKCRDAIDIICGQNASSEMRVRKVSESELTKDPESLEVHMKTPSFFPGRQALIIEDVTEKITKILSRQIADWQKLDSTIILVSKSLKASSSLRKLVDPNPRFLSFSFYDQKQSISDVEDIIKRSNLKIYDTKVLHFLRNQNNFSSFEIFENLVETLTLFKYNDDNPVTFKDIELFLTEESDSNEMEIFACLASGDFRKMVLILRNLFNKGVKPSQIIYSATNHFNLLYRISTNFSKMDEILNTNFPPLFGDRRTQVINESRIWTTAKLERANFLIFEAEKQIRSSSKLSLEAVVERCFLRIGTLRGTIN